MCDINANKNVIQQTFLCRVTQGKAWKYPGNLRKNSGNLIFKKCGHPDVGLFPKIPLETDTCVFQFVKIFLMLSTKTAEEHLIIGMTLIHSVISIVFKSLAFLKLEF